MKSKREQSSYTFQHSSSLRIRFRAETALITSRHTAMFDPSYDAVYELGPDSATQIVRWMRSEGRQK
jgi:hypothetical protein